MPASRAHALLASLFCLSCLGATFARAQVLYKWTDAEGKIHYTDALPKNPSGPVIRIEPDVQPPTAPAWKAPVAKGAPAVDAVDTETAKPRDQATQRRMTRERLEARVVAARAKLASAKAALEAGQDPQDDERQIIQQRMDKANPAPGPGSQSNGGMLGMGAMHGGAPRSNCKSGKDPNSGSTITMCPTSIPTDAYYDRIKKLEDDVKTAEDELDAAQEAYRRGVD